MRSSCVLCGLLRALPHASVPWSHGVVDTGVGGRLLVARRFVRRACVVRLQLAPSSPRSSWTPTTCCCVRCRCAEAWPASSTRSGWTSWPSSTTAPASSPAAPLSAQQVRCAAACAAARAAACAAARAAAESSHLWSCAVPCVACRARAAASGGVQRHAGKAGRHPCLAYAHVAWGRGPAADSWRYAHAHNARGHVSASVGFVCSPVVTVCVCAGCCG